MSNTPQADDSDFSYTETPLSSGAQRAFEDIQMSAAPITDSCNAETAEILSDVLKEAKKIRDGKDVDRQSFKKLKLSYAPTA